jgi:hypothetical protein
MYKATVYDRVSRARDADLDVYIGEDRAPYPPGETVLRRDQVNTGFVSKDRFREFVWEEEFEDRHFHAAMQAMMAFDEMLYTLMTDWAAHGAGKADAACGPPAVGPRVSPDAWHAYADRAAGCGEAEWRHLVQVVALMHDRIHHMMRQAMLHHGAAHGRDELRTTSTLRAAPPGTHRQEVATAGDLLTTDDRYIVASGTDSFSLSSSCRSSCPRAPASPSRSPPAPSDSARTPPTSYCSGP